MTPISILESEALCGVSWPNVLRAIGSALACIGLTVPVVVLASIAFQLPLVLGLEPTDMAMLVLTFLVSAVTLGTGRTYVMQGAVHLVLFAAFLFLAFVP
jgi:Ca2+:H+ antiporter